MIKSATSSTGESGALNVNAFSVTCMHNHKYKKFCQNFNNDTQRPSSVYRQIPVLDESPSPLLVFSIAATR
jgi:hypothetical protein